MLKIAIEIRQELLELLPEYINHVTGELDDTGLLRAYLKQQETDSMTVVRLQVLCDLMNSIWCFVDGSSKVK